MLVLRKLASLSTTSPPRRKSMPNISGQRPFGRNEAQCTFFLLLPGPEHWRTPNNLEFEEVGNGNGKPSTGFLRCADSGLEREDERMSGPVGFLPPDIRHCQHRPMDVRSTMTRDLQFPNICRWESRTGNFDGVHFADEAVRPDRPVTGCRNLGCPLGAVEPLNPAPGSCIFVLMAWCWSRQLSWKNLLCPHFLVASHQPHQKP